jgi:hypothetical protein
VQKDGQYSINLDEYKIDFKEIKPNPEYFTNLRSHFHLKVFEELRRSTNAK